MFLSFGFKSSVEEPLSVVFVHCFKMLINPFMELNT